MALFDSGRESNVKACVEMVEAVLIGRGHPLEQARLTSDRGPSWRFTHGSAHVFVFITSSEGNDFFQVVSPVMRPPDGDNARLYQRLLELNATQLTGAAFGMRERDVVISTDRLTSGLDRVEVEEMVRRVAEYADYYDDLLTVEFGGERCSDI
jgi:hypothetical protein